MIKLIRIDVRNHGPIYMFEHSYIHVSTFVEEFQY